jgi:hypothetical protein
VGHRYGARGPWVLKEIGLELPGGGQRRRHRLVTGSQTGTVTLPLVPLLLAVPIATAATALARAAGSRALIPAGRRAGPGPGTGFGALRVRGRLRSECGHPRVGRGSHVLKPGQFRAVDQTREVDRHRADPGCARRRRGGPGHEPVTGRDERDEARGVGSLLADRGARAVGLGGGAQLGQGAAASGASIQRASGRSPRRIPKQCRFGLIRRRPPVMRR